MNELFNLENIINLIRDDNIPLEVRILLLQNLKRVVNGLEV